MQLSAPARPRHLTLVRRLAPILFSSAALLTVPAIAAGGVRDSIRTDSIRRASAPSTAPTAPARRSAHVIIISIDGLRPDAIDRYRAQTLRRLMREGSYTLQAQTITPSKTLPSHVSMLTGVNVDQHGVTWNSDRTADQGHVDVPTVFALATARGLRTAAFFSKPKFHHLEAPNTIGHVRSPAGGFLDSQWLAPKTMSYVSDYLRHATQAPDLMFVHVGEPDYAGHVFGWMSGMYQRAVLEADEAVQQVLAEADDRFGRGGYTVIVTADHGGHGRTHGSSDPLDTTIPWITWGEGVTAGVRLPVGVRTMDTAATALWLLGIPAPTSWVGRAVASAYRSGPVVATTAAGGER